MNMENVVQPSDGATIRRRLQKYVNKITSFTMDTYKVQIEYKYAFVKGLTYNDESARICSCQIC